MNKLIEGHWYRFNASGREHVGHYLGRPGEIGCRVCGQGHNAHVFNVWKMRGGYLDYEACGYGTEHMPQIIEDMGERKGVLCDAS